MGLDVESVEGLVLLEPLFGSILLDVYFFNFRYYIKLETIFSQFNQDSQYLVKASERRQELYLIKKREYELE